MKNICVITGGGSGMGLATAKRMGCREGYHVIISGRNEKKLAQAVDELTALGMEAEAMVCDVSDRKSVVHLAEYAASQGAVTAVIHAAGMSPHMGTPKEIMSANALGTIYMNQEFGKIMETGCVIDVSSMSAYLTPEIIMPQKLYGISLSDPDRFMKKIMRRIGFFPKKVQTGVSYAISKHFVIWRAEADALALGKKGIRVISVSPGNFETPMGDLEKEEAATFTQYAAIKRFGDPEEIAELLEACLKPEMSYLTGVDILCDGGLVAGYRQKKKSR